MPSIPTNSIPVNSPNPTRDPAPALRLLASVLDFEAAFLEWHQAHVERGRVKAALPEQTAP